MPSIVGTWKLLHATARDSAGTAHPAVGARPPHVYQRRTHDVCGVRWAEGAAGRSQLRIQLLLRQLHLQRGKLVTRVDAASDPNRVGGDQVRAMRFEGERMLLIPPPRRTGEIEKHCEITWERIAGSSTSRLGHVTGDVLDHALLAAA